MNYEYQKFSMKQKLLILFGTLILIVVLSVTFILIRFRVVNVDVTGNQHYSKQEIEDMILNGNVLDNSLLLSLKYSNRSIEDIPFIETMDVNVTGAGNIRIDVYEKSLAGCVSFLDNFMYFDREGIVVESSKEATRGVPEITGLEFTTVALYQKLPVDNDYIFKVILSLTQLLDKYNIVANQIYFDKKENVTLIFGNARVKLGESKKLEEKIMQLSVIVPNIEGKSGVLDMQNFSENTKALTFESDE